MADVEVTKGGAAPAQERRRTIRIIEGGSSIEALIAAGAAALAILGLVGVLPKVLAAIATIGAGAALMLEGSQVAARFQHILDEVGGEREEKLMLGGGISTELMGGATAIALGILALVGVDSVTLLSVAQLVLGGSLVFGSAALPEIDEAIGAPEGQDRYREIAHHAAKAAAGPRTLAGIGAIVLGILILAHAGVATTLVLVSLLAVAGGLLLTGTVLGARTASVLHHR